MLNKREKPWSEFEKYKRKKELFDKSADNTNTKNDNFEKNILNSLKNIIKE